MLQSVSVQILNVHKLNTISYLCQMDFDGFYKSFDNSMRISEKKQRYTPRPIGL